MRCAAAARRRSRSFTLALVVAGLAGALGVACGGDDAGGSVIPGDVRDTADLPSVPEIVEDAVRSDIRKPDAFRPGEGEPGEFGAPCRRNEDCKDGWCVGWDEGYVCTQICVSSEGCPEGWECRGIFGTAPDVVFVCYPDQSNLCRPCASDFECGGGYCVTIEGEQRCTRPCGTANACPAYYTCQRTTSEEDPTYTSDQCLPTGGSCTCGPINVGKQRTCLRENEHGRCVGVETCDETRGWVGCTADTPGPEVCDGLDNDCDGFMDNDPQPPATPCETVWTDPAGVADDIVCTGVWMCDPAGEDTAWRCTARRAGPEVCDRVDNDCDGTTDEGFRDAATGRYDHYEHCGQCNRSCEGAIAFAAATECVADGDDARCVVVACQPGYFVPPDFDDICVRVGPVANCTPCADDDDCAALPGSCYEEPGQGRSYCAQDCPLGDECPAGYACAAGRCRPLSDSCNCLAQHEGLTRPCANEGPHGICQGLSTCDPDAGWSACSARVPSVEECNGVDDDCDGTTDIGLQPPGGSGDCQVENGFGTCLGTWVCPAGAAGAAGWRCTAAEPAAEACDLRDNDCDGQTDEDYRDPATGRYDDLENCGVCGYSCAGAIVNAAAVRCDASGPTPVCAVVACEDGYVPFGRFACVQARGAACRPCNGDADCPVPGDRCLELDGASVCGQDCAAGNQYARPAGECPAGYACVSDPAGLGADVRQCLPVSGSCTCLAADGGNTRPCVVANAAGTCFGRETCEPSLGWRGCDARVPADETCNGLDDNCNGLADEDAVPPRGSFACERTNGFGTCQGTWVCRAEGGVTDWRCSAPTPANDVCNYLDDDCDGATDEGYPDRDEVCFAGVGECRAAGVRECAPGGAATVCTAVPDAAGVETCNGRDDDCDGQTDEDWPLKNTPCSAGQGICTRSGVWECNPSNPTALRCNAVAGTGNPIELCDYQDDDCDGQTDEGFQTAGRYTRVTDCGACGNDCALFWTPDAATHHAVPTCVDSGAVPSCSFTCQPLYVDADGVEANGCELFADPNSIFVAVPTTRNNAADVAGCGTWDRPCASIGYGLQRAAQAPRRQRVLVSDGAYEETVTLIEGIDLLGGYNHLNWQREPRLNVTSIFGATGGSGHLHTVLAQNIRTTATVLEGFTIHGRIATSEGANSYALRVVDCNASLIVRDNVILGGYGGPGPDGAAGADGAPGPSGAAGLPPFDTAELDCTAQSRPGGEGGAHTCGGTVVSGGRGGAALCPVERAFAAGESEPAGSPGANGGGTGGVGAYSSEISTRCDLCFTPIDSQSNALPTSGGAGLPGPRGANGSGGSACAAIGGAVTGGHWTGAAAGTGVAGAAGRGGGGGGTGGGVDKAFTAGACPTRGGDTLGATGGGGGAGACGAAGGQGGGAGGGAFAIFVHFTTAPASLPVIEGNELRRGVGGRGGRGGAGGRGGVGGDGGYGGPEGAGLGAQVWCAGAGGNGGRGGDGGHAGGGGGGCGGVSFGVHLSGTPQRPLWDLANQFGATGQPGPGGTGGGAVLPTLRGTDGPVGGGGATSF
jgi:hypothetical protein